MKNSLFNHGIWFSTTYIWKLSHQNVFTEWDIPHYTLRNYVDYMSQFNDTSLKKNWKNENFWLWIFSLVQTILLWDFVNLTYPWPSEGCNFWTRCQIKNLRLQICPPWSIDTCRYPQSFHTTSLEQYFYKKPKSLRWLRS